MQCLSRLKNIVAVSAVLSCQVAWAHAPILDCVMEQGSVVCEAGFSDGSSATGRKILVRDARGKVLLDGVFDKSNRFVFQPTAKDYSVVFLGGDGHEVSIHSSSIEKGTP